MDLAKLVVIALLPILVFRAFVYFTYPERTSKIVTFGFPTLALFLFALRVAILQNFDSVFYIGDAWSVISWGLIDASQLVAAIYQWWPERKALP